jgi:hypothetical protein
MSAEMFESVGRLWRERWERAMLERARAMLSARSGC